MKELHDHIFSNTTCISKEIMLKYINKQLSVKELHEVEKHLIDCEFCSEAFEGLKYAENSSVLFAIDNQIDQRVRMGGAKSTVMRNLMVAASVLILISAAYLTFDYFEGTVANQSNLALKEENTVKDESDKIVQPNKQQLSKKESVVGAAEVKEGKLTRSLTGEQSGSKASADEDSFADVPESTEEAPMEDAEMELEEVDMVLEEELSQEIVANYNREPSTEKMKMAENESNNQRETSTSDNVGNANSGVLMDMTVERKSNDDNRDRSKKDKQKNKSAKKQSMAPTAVSESRAEEQVVMANDELATVTINTYKVVDYTEEYQKQYDLKNEVDTKSVPAGYATEADLEAAEKEKEELEVPITYKAALEKGMAYFKAEKYAMALEQFDIILKEHPEEVNGQFYGGMSYYRLNQFKKSEEKFTQVLNNERTDFNEEATWYKALSLIELERKAEAKKLLESIVKQKGFYAKKAETQLKNL